jgi:NADH-quinone oxidoreductase subunit N
MTPVLPLLILAGTSGLVLLAFPRRPAAGPWPAAQASAVGLLLALWALLVQWGEAVRPMRSFHGFLLVDRPGILAAALAIVAGLVTVGLLPAYLRKVDRERVEIPALLLLAVAGMTVMVQTDHLVSLFLGLETFSVALYALSAALRDRTASIEAGLKYFLAGAFMSGILVMGLALLYGATGSFDLPAIETALRESTPLALTGLLLVVMGFAFKLSAAPFHMWAPDVYEGAPTPLVGFMSTAVKVAAFTAFLRVLAAVPPLQADIGPALAWIAALTVLIGNLAALAQSSAKRLLAYSSIAHSGYILLAACAFLAARGPEARSAAFAAVLHYAFAYTLTNLGAFLVLGAVESREGRGVAIAELDGLKQREPVLAASFLVMLLSLGSVPLTVGFIAKWGIFEVLLARHEEGGGPGWLVLILVLVAGSVIGLAYYLRLIRALYMRPVPAGLEPVPRPARLVYALAILLALLVLWAGCGPSVLGLGAETLLDWTRAAAG